MSKPEPILLSWSGGKDSTLALHALHHDERYEVIGLLTSISEEFERISHHGVRTSLLEEQANALGYPLDKVYLPSSQSSPCTNNVYEEIMGNKMNEYVSRGVMTVAFGDIFLEDLREYRESNLAKVGMTGLFPLWKEETTTLSERFISLGYRAYLSCVEPSVGEGFVGRLYDQSLLDDLPAGIDPCGEYGEFHSFVFAGPIFKRPVDVQVGEIVCRDTRYYADLLSANDVKITTCSASEIPPVR